MLAGCRHRRMKLATANSAVSNFDADCRKCHLCQAAAAAAAVHASVHIGVDVAFCC